ncbi:hypothetical protein IV493_05880 [Pantoea sp. SM3640]|uniref:hypothetical protein n=1 Tax=Pantoea sp. SM3640 TaxID=2787629 RepID=UPI0018A72301|nr:hypothetical protein [Pantoea sp. SM3640]QPG28350.1 hypothetical protein IV493_05880 [Pantoea sp. SM3640]
MSLVRVQSEEPDLEKPAQGNLSGLFAFYHGYPGFDQTVSDTAPLIAQIFSALPAKCVKPKARQGSSSFQQGFPVIFSQLIQRDLDNYLQRWVW